MIVSRDSLNDKIVGAMSDEVMQSIKNEDSYEGFTSCPDTRRVYVMQSKENQIKWMLKSEEIIREFISRLATFKNFYEAYSYLANARHQIALALKQRGEDGRMDLYGIFRMEGDHYRQSVSAGDGEQFWKWQKNKIFELVYKIIEPVKNIKIFPMQPGYIYENDDMTCLEEKVVVDDKEATYFCVTIKFPFKEIPLQHVAYSHTLSQIELYDFGIDKRFNLIRVEYTPIDNRNIIGNYIILDKHYQSILKWQPKEGIKQFFIHFSKLAYMSAHLMLVKHGNAAIMEWMMRAIAYKQGIKIGKFNYSEGISWDFKALLTTNIDDYEKWFLDKLFIGYTLLDKSKSNSDFSFN
jgi:hypothetical protein